MVKKSTIRKKNASDLDKAQELVHYKMNGGWSGKYPPTTCHGWKQGVDQGELPGVKMIYDELMRKYIERILGSDDELSSKFELAIRAGVDFLLEAMDRIRQQDVISSDQIKEVAGAIKVLHGIDLDRKLLDQYQSPKQLELNFLDVTPTPLDE